MAEIGKAYVQIIPSAKGMKGQLTGLLDKDAGAAGDSGGKKMGAGIVGGIKGFLVKAGIGVAVTKIINDSINEGGKLEQSLGGVETLFKENADAVIKNADIAWRTAGISANEYMEQATSFSASLLQSLGGDTEKAAHVADMAIIDMADNANKFGSDVSSIQNAYQGFAKQNYTMLDNLKLGYGGTKQEMERLLKDAGKISGIKYDINNLNDVYEAIHVVQEELGVTGTTAKEAGITFQGSAAAMKSAWKNVLGNMMTGRAELKGSIIALGQSIGTFVTGNLVPAVKNIVSAVPELFVTAFNEFGPSIVDATSKFMNGAGQGITQKIPEFVGKGLEAISSFVKTITDNLPQMVEQGAQMLLSVVKGIAASLPEIGEKAVGIAGNLVTGLIKSLPDILRTGAEMLGSLITGFGDMAPRVYAKIGEVGSQIWDTLKEVDWVQLGTDIFTALKDGLSNYMGNVVAVAIDLKDQISEKAQALWSNVKTHGETYIPLAVAYAKNKFEEMKKSVKSKFESLGERISSTWNTIKANVQLKVMAVKNTITSKIQEAKDRAVSIFQNAVQPIKDTWQSIKDNISGMIENIKGLFNFEWSFPKPKMPKITVDGGEAPWGIMGHGRAPQFDVSWNADAMNNAKILDGAQIFGAMGGKFLGGGEAGREVVSGESHLMQLMAKTVQGAHSNQIDELIRIISRMEGTMYDKMVKAMQQLGIKFDERELARMVRKYA